MDSLPDVVQRCLSQVSVPSQYEETDRVLTQIEKALTNSSYSAQDVFRIRQAVEEAVVNAMKHGNQLNPQKRVVITYQVNRQRCEVSVVDEGPGFTPDEVPDCTAVENLERPCGRGVLLMRHFMDRVEYLGCGNSVKMTKYRSAMSD